MRKSIVINLVQNRSRPSVFLWSLGNEEMNIQGTEVGARILTAMKRLARRLDPTRLVTIADNNVNNSWGSEYSAVCDVIGCNYKRLGNIDKLHKDHPEKPILGTKTASTHCTRGIYAKDEVKGFVDAYGCLRQFTS